MTPPTKCKKWTADKDGTLWPLGRFVGQYAKEIADAHTAAIAAAIAAAYGKGMEDGIKAAGLTTRI